MQPAAIYARKSTEQHVADEEKSVTRQVALAIAFARAAGFEVPPEHIYVDDAMSGAEFERRSGLVRLLNALHPHAPFSALILADKDRLGREQFETNHIVKQISLAAVRIFEYQNGGQEVRLESPMDKLIMSISNFAAELERAKASQRTRDALQLKAQHGYVVGGTVFGYRNLSVSTDGDRRSHVVREIREDEAAVIQRVFQMTAEGQGLKRITLRLNAEGVPSPRAREDRHRSWAPSSVRTILFNPLYKGDVVWGRTRKRDIWGRRKQSDRPSTEWVTVKAGHLRIVSDDLWDAAHASITTRRHGMGGRPTRGTASKYLLTGFARCSVCEGAKVQGWQGFPGYPVCRCWYNQSRGRTVCTNTLTVPMHLADAAILNAVEKDVLDPEVVEAALELALRDLCAPESASIRNRDHLHTELRRLDVELKRYAEAIADAGPLTSVLTAIKVREQRRDAIRTELRAAPPLGRTAKVDPRAVKETLRAGIEQWRDMVRDDVAGGRRVLSSLIEDRLVFTPIPRPPHIPPRKGPGRKSRLIYEFSGTTTLHRILADLISASGIVAPTGHDQT